MTANKTRLGVGVCVLGVAIAAGTVSLLREQVVNTKEAGARFRMTNIHQALALYAKQHGAYPSADQSLTALCEQPERRGYLDCPHALKDPWGNPYVYKSPAAGRQSYQLYSRGPNGLDEGGRGDDIV